MNYYLKLLHPNIKKKYFAQKIKIKSHSKFLTQFKTKISRKTKTEEKWSDENG